jgi:hypothetical protein
VTSFACGKTSAWMAHEPTGQQQVQRLATETCVTIRSLPGQVTDVKLPVKERRVKGEAAAGLRCTAGRLVAAVTKAKGEG